MPDRDLGDRIPLVVPDIAFLDENGGEIEDYSLARLLIILIGQVFLLREQIATDMDQSL